MIEADVMIGKYNSDPDPSRIIMGHPPTEASDLLLVDFLRQVSEHNNVNVNVTKGVKLDFKTKKAYDRALEVLKEQPSTVRFFVYRNNLKITIYSIFFYFYFKYQYNNLVLWINADILTGPIGADKVDETFSKEFFDKANKLGNVTLSVGWSTKFVNDSVDRKYTPAQIDEMIKVIVGDKIEKKNAITFPIRATFAASSKDELHRLVKEVQAYIGDAPVTITLWHGNDDPVDVDELSELILSFGLNKVYIDLPEKIRKQLKLDTAEPSSASSIIHFGIINLAIFAFCSLLNSR